MIDHGTRRHSEWLSLSWLARYLALPVALMLIIFSWEFISGFTLDSNGNYGLKPPSIYLGEMSGRHEAAQLRTQQEIEAQYKRAVVEAENKGKLQTELEYKPKLEQVRVDYESRLQANIQELQRTTQAYNALYDRYKEYVTVAYAMEAKVLEFQQRVASGGMAGANAAANLYDFFCAFGSPEACGQGSRIRQGLANELGGIGRINSILPRNPMEGVPDPASLRVQADQRSNTTYQPQPQPQPQPQLKLKIYGKSIKNGSEWSFEFYSNNLAVLSYQNGIQKTVSYSSEQSGSGYRFCLEFNNGIKCKILKNYKNSAGWFDEGEHEPSSLIYRIEK